MCKYGCGDVELDYASVGSGEVESAVAVVINWRSQRSRCVLYVTDGDNEGFRMMVHRFSSALNMCKGE
jgi:hypothetical protein